MVDGQLFRGTLGQRRDRDLVVRFGDVEATEATHEYSGLIAVVGFLLAFVLSKLGS